jgi:hypothetical protein
MAAAFMMLLTLLAFANVCLLIRRRQRRVKADRMTRALRGAIRREVGVETAPAPIAAALVLQQAS